MMFFEGNIGAPPTITVVSLAKVGMAVKAAKIRPAAATPDNANLANFMTSSLSSLLSHRGYGQSYGGMRSGGCAAGDDVFVSRRRPSMPGSTRQFLPLVLKRAES